MVAKEASPPHLPASSGLTTHSGTMSLIVTETTTDDHNILRKLPCGTPYMIGGFESRKEDITLKRKSLLPNLKAGSWNVCTLRQTGKLKELCDEASRYMYQSWT